MSEHEEISGAAADSSAMLVQSATSRHLQPIRPCSTMEVREDTAKELQKRAKPPAVPSTTDKEEIKEMKEIHEMKEIKEIVKHEKKGKTESERAMTSGKHKYNVAKNLSTINKRRSISPDSIVLSSMPDDVKLKEMVTPSIPIPAHLTTNVEDSSHAAKDAKKQDDEDSISEDIPELRTPEVAKVSSEWSDEEEAGGLPRSESRASRVSRAVRQLFCCGVALDPPSEHNVSPRTEYQGI